VHFGAQIADLALTRRQFCTQMVDCLGHRGGMLKDLGDRAAGGDGKGSSQMFERVGVALCLGSGAVRRVGYVGQQALESVGYSLG
jgi:hypothetical protein